MELKMYSVHDEKGAIYNTPFFSKTNLEAIRSFGDLVQDTNTTINKHPCDYRLYQLGSYDNINGIVKTQTEPQFIIHAIDFLQTEEPKNESK